MAENDIYHRKIKDDPGALPWSHSAPYDKNKLFMGSGKHRRKQRLQKIRQLLIAILILAAAIIFMLTK